MQVTEELLLQLPKTDLHCHLDGSLRVETILELAAEQKVKLPADDPDRLRDILTMDDMEHKSLVDYLKAFEITLSVLQTAEALERATHELIEDAAKENVRYLEIRYSPILHTKNNLRLTTIVDSVLRGMIRGERDFSVKTGMIVCGMRNSSPRTSLKLAELSVAYKDRGVIGFDLAGAEADFPAKKHKDAFFLILDNNINCTAHAGESLGPRRIHKA
ncbi:MAG: adenosine deaminase, partial [bacterium]